VIQRQLAEKRPAECRHVAGIECRAQVIDGHWKGTGDLR
jgi:hypothetical protein